MLKETLGVEASLEKGGLGEFSVSVSGRVVARKSLLRFPADATILARVRRALGEDPPPSG